MVAMILLAPLQSDASPPPDAGFVPTFNEQCTAPGVFYCEGFETGNFGRATEPNTGMYGENGTPTGLIRATQDTATSASGSASIKFALPPGSGSDTAGSWRVNMGQLGHQFGENSQFYLQFKQRFSPEMTTITWQPLASSASWKQIIISSIRSSCGNVELTIRNLDQPASPDIGDYPQMYTACGQRNLSTSGHYEQGDYFCDYNYPTTSTCAYYHPDEWQTFYLEITIGTWGQANSSVRAWVAYAGGPLKQWIDQPAYTLNAHATDPSLKYDYLTFGPYITNKSSAQAHPTAYTWYDDIIASTQPIPQLGGSANPAPAAPSNLAVQ